VDESEFLDSLVGEGFSKEAGAEFLEKLKTAGPLQTASKFVRSHAPEIAGAILGGALLGGASYLNNKPKKDGGPSNEQRLAKKLNDKSESTNQEGFTSGAAGASAKFYKNLTDVFAKHPGKAALVAVPVGASLGVSIAKKLK
jgi:hypothetical protein